MQADYQEPRKGDVRHSLADISRARELLGFAPQVDLANGLKLTMDWWKNSRFAKQRSKNSNALPIELIARRGSAVTLRH